MLWAAAVLGGSALGPSWLTRSRHLSEARSDSHRNLLLGLRDTGQSARSGWTGMWWIFCNGGGRAMTARAWEEEKAGLWRERRAKEKCGRNRWGEGETGSERARAVHMISCLSSWFLFSVYIALHRVPTHCLWSPPVKHLWIFIPISDTHPTVFFSYAVLNEVFVLLLVAKRAFMMISQCSGSVGWTDSGEVPAGQ